MKHASAIFTALVITAVVGLGIAVIGVSAIANPNTVPIQSSPASSASGNSLVGAPNTNSGSSTDAATQVQQLQQQVASLQSQLNQASQVVQQYQQIMAALQQRGIIQVDQNGNIFLRQSGDDH